MTCAKRVVHAHLFAKHHGFTGYFMGINSCRTPQKVCPRKTGEGYDKCKSICKQPWHAEQHAIYLCLTAGVSPQDGHMIVDHQPCQECQDIMRAWGISWEVM
jgi:deoxycytidylate deaminase